MNIHRVHASPWRSSSDLLLEPAHGLVVAFENSLHTSVRQVPHPAADTLLPSRFAHEKPEADALHAARYDTPTRHEHRNSINRRPAPGLGGKPG